MGFASRLLRRRFSFDLHPAADLARRGEDRWQATGDDPSFLLIPREGQFPAGWVALQSTLLRQGENKVAKLYYDSGAGFSPEGYVVVPVAAPGGKIEHLVELPARVTALRWDPMESPGEITQGPFVVREISSLEGIVRTWFRGLMTGEAAPAPLARPAIERLQPNAGRLTPESDGNEGDYGFFLDHFDQHGAAGWVIDRRSPQVPVEVDFYLNDELIERKAAVQKRADVAESGKGGPYCGFWFAVPPRFRGLGVLRAKFCAAGSRQSFDGLDYLYTAREIVIRGALDACDTINRLARGADADAVAALRRVVLPEMLRKLRADWRQLPEVIAVPEAGARAAERVDVVVPAYRGVDETVACIESVLRARVSTPFELTVINDCSPEPALSQALRALSTRHGFALIENESNSGFVRTANKGMMLRPDRDVVLLNSDTEVADGWLDRMRKAAYGDANIATVTPFSNRATICSFPSGTRDNGLPDGVPLAELAAKCAEANDGAVVPIPTAVGFCMYVRRAALDEVGYFDEQRWGKGYGEENDFCLRASTLGWRHVIACDVFVAHHGQTSFAGDKAGLVARNSEKLNGLYPDYAGTIRRFVEHDPVAPARRRLFVALARSLAGRYILFLNHVWGGGANVAATDLAERLQRSGEAVLFLSAPDHGTLELGIFGSNLAVAYKGPQRYSALLDDLLQLGIWHVHIHQLTGFGPEIYELLPKLGVAHDVTVHDYFYVCPRVNLVDGSDTYCGEPDAEGCNRCLASHGPHDSCHSLYPALGPDIRTWRARQGALLEAARLVIAPSRDVERRIRRYFPLRNIAVKPHPERVRMIPAARTSAAGTVNVAVIGAIGVHKGFKVLKACAEDARRRSLPLRFVVVGYTCDDKQLARMPNVVITGQYKREQLGEILARHQCALAAFFSVCPETFSYTLSEALVHGLYPVVFDLGAQAERVRQIGRGLVLPLDASASVINDRLLSASAGLAPQPASVIGADYADIGRDYYLFAGSAAERESANAPSVSNSV
jgi:GT2 family glycosyltransferase